jgi:antitoxin HicB
MVIAAQIADAMQRKGFTKTAMAAEMQTTRAQLDRLLDPSNDSVTLATLKRAAKALGKTLRLELT